MNRSFDRSSVGGFTLIELPAVRKCGRSAFTLIELLVVVAIIAVLISILVPSLQEARELSKRTLCAGNERGMHTGLIMYAMDNDDYLPERPTKGLPSLSSSAPGASPISIQAAFPGPSPGTAWFRPSQRGQDLQPRISSAICTSLSIKWIGSSRDT